MNQELADKLKSYPNIKGMLDGLNPEIWDIFLPESPEDLQRLENHIMEFKTRQVEREKVIAIQQLCDFPLRPNQPLREVTIRARIAGMKKSRQIKRRRPGNRDKK